MIINSITWSQLKSFVDGRGLSIQWIDFTTHYALAAFDNNYELCYMMPKTGSSEQTEFESGYKATGNQRLKARSSIVDGIVDAISSAAVPSVSNNLIYSDMTGIARGTTVSTAAWSTVYSYSGSGLLYGFSLGLNSAQSNWLIRLVVDGKEIFSSTGLLTDDLSSSTIYNLATGSTPTVVGINITTDTSNIKWSGPSNLPIKYNSNVQILIKRIATNKIFTGGVVVITKES